MSSDGSDQRIVAALTCIYNFIFKFKSIQTSSTRFAYEKDIVSSPVKWPWPWLWPCQCASAKCQNSKQVRASSTREDSWTTPWTMSPLGEEGETVIRHSERARGGQRPSQSEQRGLCNSHIGGHTMSHSWQPTLHNASPLAPCPRPLALITMTYSSLYKKDVLFSISTCL